MARGATIVVTTTDDSLAVDGFCSLREAVRAANTNAAVDACAKGAGADTIRVPAGLYEFELAPTGGDPNNSGDLVVTGPTTIDGAGERATVLDPRQLDRAFSVTGGSGTNVVFSDLTIQNGFAELSFGGAIHSVGVSLTIENVTFLSNSTDDGGAVRATGPARIVNSRFFENDAHLNGGAIRADAGLILVGSLVSNNSVTTSDGGGIAVFGGTARITGSVVARNTAGSDGGGIFSRGPLFLTDSQVARNDVSGSGGGIYQAFEQATLVRTTVERNAAVNGAGGGVYAISGAGVTARSSFFLRNTAGDGGGLYLIGDDDGLAASDIRSSTIAWNRASDGGGGLLSNHATLIDRSFIYRNAAGDGPGTGAGHGNGIFNTDNKPLTVRNTTIFENGEGVAFEGLGGGLYNDDRAEAILQNVTFSSNAAGIGGGGGNIYNAPGAPDGSVEIRNTVVEDPLTGQSCEGAAVTDVGPNLEFNSFGGLSCGFTLNGDPLLGAPAANGGPTRTMAIAAGSAALNEGSGCLAVDQRGVPRPQGGGCDLGAYERATCRGGVVNRVGTPGRDVLGGTAAADVFLLLGGRDEARGLGGADRFCGGAGRDLLIGGPGADVHDGGSGRDRCTGGAGSDTAFSCEIRRGIP